jgi:hypothetical protein
VQRQDAVGDLWPLAFFLQVTSRQSGGPAGQLACRPDEVGHVLKGLDDFASGAAGLQAVVQNLRQAVKKNEVLWKKQQYWSLRNGAKQAS